MKHMFDFKQASKEFCSLVNIKEDIE